MKQSVSFLLYYASLPFFNISYNYILRTQLLYLAVSCTIWEHRDIKKADLSVLDISSAIIARVETMPETPDYFYTGVVLSLLLAFLPPLCRLSESAYDAKIDKEMHFSVIELPTLIADKFSGSVPAILDAAFGKTSWY